MSTATLSPTWQTEDLESDITGKYGASLVSRARKRKVVHPGPMAHNRFMVLGDPKLGDAYDEYHVQFNGRTYRCSCRDHAHGQSRTLCSHVLAVIFYRKANRTQATVDLIRGGGGAAHEKAVDAAVSADATSAAEVVQQAPASPDEVDEVMAIPDPRDPMWGEPPLPEWVTEIRPHQWKAVVEAVEAFGRGDRVVFVDAPTGSGKTLLAELVRRMLKTKALYVASTKSLQEQAARDFPYAKVLKGRANYPTADDPDAFESEDRWGNARLTAADCTRQMAQLPACVKCPVEVERQELHCANCHPVSACPYSIAKNEALGADLTILNTSYFLSEANGPGKFSSAINQNSAFGLVIVDEADLLENELMGQVEVRITETMRKKYSIEPPAKKTVEASWLEWVTGEAIPKIGDALKKTPAKSQNVTVIRERQRLERLATRLKVLAEGLGDGNWVADDWERNGAIVFRPVKVDRFGGGMLWRHGVRFLCMSATILSADLMAEVLGL